MSDKFTIPEQLEELKSRKIWLCYPMIWNETKHNGHGGYDKPPVNPYTLYNGSSDNPESLSTFDEAVAQIGKTARVRVKNHDDMVESPIVGVGVAFSGTGLFGLDLDNVVRQDESGQHFMTKEASQIVEDLDSYTEISPSGEGLHIICFGEIPSHFKKIAKPKPDIFKTNKAEYQLFDSGYMTISGQIVGSRHIADRSEKLITIYETYFQEVEAIQELSKERPTGARRSSSVVSSDGFTFDRWLDDIRFLSDSEILERIFKSGSTGSRVERLYNGDMSEYDNDHSRADQALCTFFYGFTQDRGLTERLFRSSSLYRSHGKSRNYLERTLNKAEIESVPLTGHIEITDEDRRQYAQKKMREELSTWEKTHPKTARSFSEKARLWSKYNKNK